MAQSKFAHTWEELISFTNKLCDIAARGMTKLGPFHKEGIYQEMLQCDMKQQLNISSTREQVMAIRSVDGNGNPITLGNGQFLRTDIELLDTCSTEETEGSAEKLSPPPTFSQLERHINWHA